MLKVNAEKIRQLMFERGINLTRLAQQTGLNPTTVRRLVNDGSAVNFATLGAVAQFFNVDGNELIFKDSKEVA